VKRQKKDAPNLEAICEAVQRPTMRFCRGEDRRNTSAAVLFPGSRSPGPVTHSDHVNALRGHLTEFRHHRDQGSGERFEIDDLSRRPGTTDLPASASSVLVMLVDQLRALDSQVARLRIG
jgi:transposase